MLFSFVSNTLSYITIQKKQKKIKFKPRIKLNHNIYIKKRTAHVKIKLVILYT